jgi:alpha-beta hydrolase superfamily lysophospholipase
MAALFLKAAQRGMQRANKMVLLAPILGLKIRRFY